MKPEDAARSWVDAWDRSWRAKDETELAPVYADDVIYRSHPDRDPQPPLDYARAAFADLVKPLVEISKCPDYVVNRGHYFGTDYFAEETPLTDADKRALIAFLKTL